MQETHCLRENAWQSAYQWLCRRRRHAPDNAGVWHTRFFWESRGKALFDRVCAGQYQLSPMEVVGRASARCVQWQAQDALVLKWVALLVAPQLPLHSKCMHVRGHGGALQAARVVQQAVLSGEYQYAFRTDIRGYYQHIRKSQAEKHVRQYIRDPVLCDLLIQYLHYCVDDGGEIFTPENGICRGCALSPLLGASLLYPIDSAFAAAEDLFYVRYMDDFIILARTRWRLRKAIQRLCRYFQQGGFERHPDKTHVGRIEKGFDWMGLWLSPTTTRIAPRALDNHRARRLRLYERARQRGECHQATLDRVRKYRQRWTLWAQRLIGTGVGTPKDDLVT